MLDLVLAILHHITIVTLVVLIGAEFSLVRKGIAGAALGRLAIIDGAYGASAGAILLVGAARVGMAARGWTFYEHNPWFWAKMGSFLATGLISILPTLSILKWRKAAKANPAFTPPDAEIASARLWIHIEIGLICLIVAFAAAMARFGQF